MDPDNVSVSIESFISKLLKSEDPALSSIFKEKLSSISTNQGVSVNTFSTEEMSEVQKINYIINSVIKEISDSPACIYFTNNTSPNISEDYQYANNAPFHTCSNKLFASDVSSVTPCRAVLSQQHCSGYSIDQEIVSTCSVDSTTYFLIKYRKITGSMTYIIADSNCNVYQIISHESSLPFKSNDMNEDATHIFSSYISDLISSKDFSLEFPVNEKQQEKSSTSYLSYVLG